MDGFFDDLPDLGLPDTPVRRRRPAPTDADGVPVVYYVKVKCPNRKCRSEDCPVYSTDLPFRYHKCRRCGLNFKSIEQK